jgi:hypothetical protein
MSVRVKEWTRHPECSRFSGGAKDLARITFAAEHQTAAEPIQ